jgi:hypothetical protein
MVKEITINSLQKDIESLEKRIEKLEIEVKNGSKPKKVKDPLAPKKYKTAYMFFNIERINEQKKKFPGDKIIVSEIAKQSGKEWIKIKEDEKKYEKYKKLEDNDKKRYKKELDKYEKNKD